MDPNKDKAGWDYKPSGGTAVADKSAPKTSGAAGVPPADAGLAWTASEYIEHERGAAWYLLLLLATAALAAVAYLISKDYITVGVIVVLGVIVAAAAGRKPRQIQYQLTAEGIQAGARSYSYHEFRSFSVIREDSLSSIEFIPLKRFMLPVSAYFGPGDEERIMDTVGQHLPYEERRMPVIDRLSRRLRL